MNAVPQLSDPLSDWRSWLPGATDEWLVSARDKCAHYLGHGVKAMREEVEAISNLVGMEMARRFPLVVTVRDSYRSSMAALLVENVSLEAERDALKQQLQGQFVTEDAG